MGMFTGCLPSTTGIYQNEPLWEVPGRRLTIVELLRAAGYYTFGAGKVFHGVFDYATAGREGQARASWHEIENRSFLWDDFRHNRYEPLPDNRPLNGLFDFSRFEDVPPSYHHFDWGPIPDERAEELPDALVYSSIADFLGSSPRQPFFCAAGFYKPHLPWHVPSRFFDLYDPARITLPVVKHDDLEDVPPIAREWARTPNDHDLVTVRQQWSHAVHGYLASISYVDSLIGKLSSKLKTAGLYETTTIILCGDNGFHLGEKLHWRKFVLWEEATRVPLIVVPAGSAQIPQRVYDPVSLIDLFPTLAELACLENVPPTDGTSLLFPFKNARSRAIPVIMTWGRGNHSVRQDNWRYTKYSDSSEELYDQVADPHEWTNLAGDPAFKGVCERLSLAIPTDYLE